MENQMTLKDKIIVAILLGIIAIAFACGAFKPIEVEAKSECRWTKVPSATANMEICK